MQIQLNITCYTTVPKTAEYEGKLKKRGGSQAKRKSCRADRRKRAARRRGESLVAQLDSAVNQAEQPRTNKFSRSIATSWTTSKKPHAQWEQQVARRNLEWTSPVDELRKLLNPPSGDYIETNVIKD